MKDEKQPKERLYVRYHEQFVWGIMALAVLCIAILFFFGVYRWKGLTGGIGNLKRILQPFWIAIALAWLLTPLYNLCERLLLPRLQKNKEKPKRGETATKAIGIIVCMAVFFGVVYALCVAVIPQVISSIVSIINNSENYVTTVTDWANKVLDENPTVAQWISQLSEDIFGDLSTFAESKVLPWLTSIFGKVSLQIIGAFRFVINFIIGIIVCIYILLSKRTLAAQAKRICYSILRVDRANTVIHSARYCNSVFSGFLSGKVWDSLIVGIICFIGLSIMKIPYTLLISVVSGITNMIPNFGPFIGAVPCGLLLLVEDPIKCLYFIIFTVILQQIDGNIIGPKILGDALGLPELWVMLALVLGGGFAGILGLLLGVPVFTCLYTFGRWAIRHFLKKRGMPENTEAYERVGEIDPSTGDVSAIPQRQKKWGRKRENRNNEQ